MPAASLSLLDDLRVALAREGLFIVQPLSHAALDGAQVGLRLADLLPRAAGALVIGDGGGVFFQRFLAAADHTGVDPLDRYTAQVVPAAIRAVVGADAPLAVRYPFDDERPVLPMQALGLAAGLPAPGPLGIQVHPIYGPWWAYRALVVLPWPLQDRPALRDCCGGCPAPCEAACPGQAVHPRGLDIVACAGHRLGDPACHHTCVARRACIVGPEHGYSEDQLAFHMAASLVSVRRYFGR